MGFMAGFYQDGLDISRHSPEMRSRWFDNPLELDSSEAAG
jgi:hypothetical protein